MQISNIRVRRALGAALTMCCLAGAHAQSSGDWPLYSHDYANTNANPDEWKISRQTAPTLRRAWETFNDSQWRPTPPPTGFILESALGLKFPSSVVGVIAPPIIRDGTIYYIDALGTLFARNSKTGTITDASRHWTTTLVDPDYTASTPAIAPDLYYSAPVVSGGLIWIHSSFNGRLHAIKRVGGAELDFDAAKPGIQPFAIVPGETLASNLGEPVIVRTYIDPLKSDAAADGTDLMTDDTPGTRKLFITEVNVILNDALIQGGQGGTSSPSTSRTR